MSQDSRCWPRTLVKFDTKRKETGMEKEGGRDGKEESQNAKEKKKTKKKKKKRKGESLVAAHNLK